MLQTTPFRRAVEQDTASFDISRGHQVPKLLLEKSKDDVATTSFADYTARVEASLHPQNRTGRGVNVEVTVGPMLPPKATGYVWTGGPAKFWGRLAVLHKKGLKAELSSQAQVVLQKHLNLVAEYWEDLTDITMEEAIHELQAHCAKMGGRSPKVMKIIDGQRKHHLQVHHSFGAAQYQNWLEGAQTGGLRPLFRSLKKSEVQTARPFLDLAVEVRPHARRAFWAEMWDPGVLNPPLALRLEMSFGKKHAFKLKLCLPLSLAPCKRRWPRCRTRPRGLMAGVMKCSGP